MATPHRLLFHEGAQRLTFAIGVTIVAVAAVATRDTPEVDWPILGVITACFWWWAIADGPRLLVDFFGIAGPLTLNIVESADEISLFIVVLTVSLIAGAEPNRRRVTFTVGLTFVLLPVLAITDALLDVSWPIWLLGIGLGWVFGDIVYRYQDAVTEMLAARELVADQAILHERRRIARDVHDLVGHSLAVMMMHVTGARHLIDKDPDEAARALEQAEAAGRNSMREIRQTIGLLRADGDPEETGLPSPTVADIPELVGEFLVAGLDVQLTMTGDDHDVDGPVGVAAYRIVQEALTNASRHVRGADVAVTVSVDSTRCEVSVINRGGTPTNATSGDGYGLRSMRERARTVNGSLLAGPTTNGWSVEASLPLTTSSPLDSLLRGTRP